MAIATISGILLLLLLLYFSTGISVSLKNSLVLNFPDLGIKHGHLYMDLSS